MDPITLGLAISLHIGFPAADYNKYHPFAEYETKNNYAVGVMYNSEDTVSVYAKKEWKFTDDSFIELGWATGYDEIEKEYDIPITPFARLGYEVNDSLTIWAMPGGAVDRSGNFQTGIVIGTQKRF